MLLLPRPPCLRVESYGFTCSGLYNCGCGFIRLTGKANYRRQGLAIGEPLLEQPERANEFAIAAALLTGFIKAKERQVKEARVAGDLRWARRLVNGGATGWKS